MPQPPGSRFSDTFKKTRSVLRTEIKRVAENYKRLLFPTFYVRDLIFS